MMHEHLWSSAYAAAVLETDQSKIPALIAAAETAISARSVNSVIDSSERQAMESAKAALITLWKERVGIGAFLILRLFDDSLLAQF